MLRRRPQLVESTLRPRFPQLDEAQLAAIVSHSRFEVGLSNLLLSTLRQEGAWLEQRGEPRAERIRFRDVLAPGLLEELAPESVTLLRPPERSLPWASPESWWAPKYSLILGLIAALAVAQWAVTRYERRQLEGEHPARAADGPEDRAAGPALLGH